MQSKNRARVIWTALFVMWLCFVWGHSLVPADASTEESSRFVFLVRPIFELFNNHDEELMTFVIRKIAHFSEYVVLMALALQCFRSWEIGRPKMMWALLVVWVCVPAIDETIQGFVPERDPRVMDVLIDMSGGMLGMAISHKLRITKGAK